MGEPSVGVLAAEATSEADPRIVCSSHRRGLGGVLYCIVFCGVGSRLAEVLECTDEKRLVQVVAERKKQLRPTRPQLSRSSCRLSGFIKNPTEWKPEIKAKIPHSRKEVNR